MRWLIFFLYFFFLFLHGGAVRRQKPYVPRQCRPSSNICAQRCSYYSHKRMRCRCNNGFAISRTNSKDCVDINECSSHNGNCEHICSNIPGSYWCSCRPGYRLAYNQRNCVPEASTDCDSSNPCQHFCNRTSTGHLCYCRRGYRLHSNGRNCIRMCLYGNGGCHHICNREGDRMFCTCRSNYVLADDGRTCTMHHSCAVDNGGCNAACEDTPIGVQCSCSEGYLLRSDRRSCQDIDECATDNGGCERGCRNSQGSYICTCPPGYKLASDERSCVDIDECQLNDTCWSGCINSPGNYTCTCNKGFQKFAVKRCGDINECTVNNGGCAHTCVNTFGGYKCSCNHGYKLHWNEKDCVRTTTCYTARRLVPPALLRCMDQDCFLECRTTSNFVAYYSPTPSYKYACGREEGHGSPRTKRGAVTTRPLWWKNNLEVNDTLPDCAVPTKEVYTGRFSLKVDHCHLLRVSSAPDLATQPHRASISYFSITCATSKKRKRTKVVVNISFNYRFSNKKCNANCRRIKATRAGKRMLNAVKRSIKRQVFRLGFDIAHLLIRKKSTSKRETRPTPGIHSPAGCLYGRIRDSKRSCALCDSGTFFNVLTSSCEPCPPGTYQGKRGQLSCNLCPQPGQGKTASSVAIQQCPGVCPEGHFSADGFLPCQSCPIGSYQPETGRIGCFRCGQDLTTRDVGSESFSDCLVRAVCTAGHFYNPLTSSCKRCPIGFYQPDPGKDFCFSCPGNTTTDYDASGSVESCKDTHCGGVIGELHGVIESPNYPGNYPINSRCTWLIRPPKNRKLLLVIPEIFLPGLDCEDSLVMRSRRGPGEGKVSYESCQTFENPFAFTALSKRLYVDFSSNDNVGAKGFQIPYVTYDENYDAIIQDIVRDSRLLSPDLFQPILKDKLSRQTLFEVLAKPEMYFNLSREKTNELFPPSFVAFLEQKVTKFFSP